jgi:hypothetical protein
MKNQFLRAITTFYIVLPSFFFAYGWLRLPFAIVSILIFASFTVAVFLDAFRAFPNWKILLKTRIKQYLSPGLIAGIALVFFLTIIWLGFSGTGGFGFQNSDYVFRKALLNDLINQDWPLTAVIDGARVHIVYNIAYYLPAAAFGKAFGWAYANIFLFVWTLIGILLALAWFWNLSNIKIKNGAGKFGFVAAVFFLAGGLDIIGYLLRGNAYILGNHIENWAEYFQYSSNTTLIYWVPHHAIASWLIIGLIVDALYNKQNLKYLGMAVAGGIIWSPFWMVGCAPYLLLTLFVYLQPKNQWHLFNWKSILYNVLSIVIGSIYLLYLGSHQLNLPMGFIWQFVDDPLSLAKHLLAFWGLEFGLLGLLILLLLVLGVLFYQSEPFRSRWDKRLALLEREFRITPIQLYLFIVSLIMLGVLPLFKIGTENDLVMRASIPPLFIFWAFIAKVVLDASRRVRIKFQWLYTLVLMILIIGFIPSLSEIARSAKNYHFGPPNYSKVVTLVNSHSELDIGREDTIFYRYLSK